MGSGYPGQVYPGQYYPTGAVVVYALPTVSRTQLESSLADYGLTGPRYRLHERLPDYTVERG